LACTYVGSLYLWPNPRNLQRDHPEVIRRRFISLAGSCAVAWVPLWRVLRAPPAAVVAAVGGAHQLPPLLHALGVSPTSVVGLLTSSFATLGLSAALFTGPLLLLTLDGELLPRFTAALRLDSIQKYRNVIVAPLSEEFAFRACMCPLLLLSGAASICTAVLASPCFFGVAHAHHFVELRRRTGSVSTAFMATAFQFAYTTLFGWFATFVFIRTGHLAGPVLAHAFCNVMGLPDVGRAAEHERAGLIGAAYVLGVVVFAAGLWPATDPAWHPASLWGDYVAIARAAAATAAK